MDSPHRTYGQLASAAIVIAWQHYRSTFHANVSAACFCMVLTCCSAVFLTLIFLIFMFMMAYQFFTKLALPPLDRLVISLVFLAVLISIARSNLRWWLELKQWQEEKGDLFPTHRFTLQEVFLLTLFVGIALGVARFYSSD